MITKDEARILSEAINIAKYDMHRGNRQFLDNLTKLQNKLASAGKDKRRTGRTSMDDWDDLIKRYTNQ